MTEIVKDKTSKDAKTLKKLSKRYFGSRKGEELRIIPNVSARAPWHGNFFVGAAWYIEALTE